jgi:hypothetical protein
LDLEKANKKGLKGEGVAGETTSMRSEWGGARPSRKDCSRCAAI